MKVHECRSVSESLQKSTEIALRWSDAGDPPVDVWYRGVNDRHDLLPSAYWRNVDENSSLVTFGQLVRNIADTTGFDDWDYYCLARHHGIPTRLLDWCEGFIQALFFAFDGWDGHGTPCIWMLAPAFLNDRVTRDDYIFAPGGKFTDMWLPQIKAKTNRKSNVSNELPIAIYPAKSNPRIIGQLGVFTVHGVDKRPLNTILDKFGDPNENFARIDFVDFQVKAIRKELHYLGLRKSVFYPDADHIARDVGYMHCWLDSSD